jgi:hypothetical protein
VTVKLGFSDVAELLAVLEGRSEQAGGRNGLFHATPRGSVLITCRAGTEGAPLYLGVSAKRAGAEEPVRIGMWLSPAEVVGLRCLFQTGLFLVTFPGLLGRSS